MATFDMTHGMAPGNPLDTVEQVVAGYDWLFDRHSDEEMAVRVPGQWTDYSLHFAWSQEMSALHFTCAFDMRVPEKRRREVSDLLAVINEKLWLGHFGIVEDEGLPLFRHTLLLRGSDGASIGQLEDLVDIAVAECERFYPAFQFVIWSGKTAGQAVEAAMLETMGEA